MSVHVDLRISRGIFDALVGGGANIEPRQASTDRLTAHTRGVSESFLIFNE